MAEQIEKALLADGALVIRTRVAATSALLAFARLGAFIIVESDEPAPIALQPADFAGDAHEFAADFEQAPIEEILSEIQRITSQDTGDSDNDNGLGI